MTSHMPGREQQRERERLARRHPAQIESRRAPGRRADVFARAPEGELIEPGARNPRLCASFHMAGAELHANRPIYSSLARSLGQPTRSFGPTSRAYRFWASAEQIVAARLPACLPARLTIAVCLLASARVSLDSSASRAHDVLRLIPAGRASAEVDSFQTLRVGRQTSDGNYPRRIQANRRLLELDDTSLLLARASCSRLAKFIAHHEHLAHNLLAVVVFLRTMCEVKCISAVIEARSWCR